MINGTATVRIIRTVEIGHLSLVDGHPVVHWTLAHVAKETDPVALLQEQEEDIWDRPHVLHAEGTHWCIGRVGFRNTVAHLTFPTPVVVTGQTKGTGIVYLHSDTQSIGRDLRCQPTYRYDPNTDAYRRIDSSIYP